MAHPISLFGAAALGVALAFSWTAEAQTIHHRAKHPRAAGEAGRQITVRHAVEPWLTLGTWAPVGSRNGYALDTLQPPQRDTVQHTFVGVRGTDRLPNQYSLPESYRPLITVAWPGYNGPLLDLY
jgi:hypothetical protein